MIFFFAHIGYVPSLTKLFYNMSYLMLKIRHKLCFINSLKFNFITSIMVCFKSRSKTVAYLV